MEGAYLAQRTLQIKFSGAISTGDAVINEMAVYQKFIRVTA